MKIKNITFDRIWNSSTLMTWMSYFTKSANLLLVLPLIVKKFQAPEIAIWYLFATMLSMAGLVDLGFRNTFVRLFAHAFGGAKEIKVFHRSNSPAEASEGPNWILIEELYSIMRKMYIYLSGLLFVILLTIGSWSMIKPISQTQNHYMAWIAWLVIVLGIVYDFYGKVYSNYLEGLFQIALVRRIETIYKLGSIFTSFAVLLYAPTLLNLAIANSVWLIINTVRDKYLALKIFERKSASFTTKPFKKEFFMQIWRPAWRSGFSSLMSNGLTNLTSILYAQFGNAPLVASYTIGLRVITEIRNVANAPFYSKVPLIARLRAEGNYEKLIAVAKRGMQLSHLVYVIATIGVGLFFNDFIGIIGSNIRFVDAKLWILLSLAFYIHRYGALHMQLYLTTNHIIAHIADGVSGAIFIVTSLILINFIGIYAVPVSMIISYLGFYAWYAAYHSLKSMDVSFFKFEYKVSIVPACLFIVYSIVKLI